jgi:hypothetical protein
VYGEELCGLATAAVFQQYLPGVETSMNLRP